VFCPKCGTELPDDSQFCRKCGRALGTVTAVLPTTAKTERKRPLVRWPFILLAALPVLWAWFALTHPPNTPGGALSPPPNALAARAIEQAKKDQDAYFKMTGGTADSTSTGPPPPRLLSPQEIYQNNDAGMVLIETYDDEGRERGLGSGFVVSSDGTTITNYHVIRGASRATVKFADGTVGSVDGVASYDRNRDLAVIRLTPSPKTALEIGDSDKVQVGDKVVAIGSPLGLQNTMSVGIVSALRNGVIQMSDPISPGSSGGAVFDEHGKVVAVAVAQMVAGQNLNFAIPINWAKPYLNGQSPRPLSNVAAENTVTENVVSGSVAIPQGQAQTWNITVDPNKMSNAEVHGQVSSTGGMDGKITLALYFQGQPIFSCRERACEIHQSIVNPGVYILTLDNRISPIFARTVTGQVSLKYVR
jgi:S1-C subfamily serine protease